MTRIVTTHYRYKRPPRKKAKDVAIEQAVVTIPRRTDVPDLTPEEHQRRGEAADALFRKAIGKDQP